MKKAAKLVLFLLVAVMVLTACQPAATETPAVVEEAPAVDASGMSFAMVTDQSGLGDQAFNDATWEGFTALNEDYGVQIKVVETSEQAQYVPNLSTLAEENEDLIVGVGFLLKDAMNEVAPLYPDTHFALIDNFVDQPNVACIQFKENEGAFLMGAIAAYMTETGKVGFVGGMETDVVKKFEMGYRAGVMTVNPDVEVLVSYAGSFADPAKGKELALAQYEEGADVVFQVAGFTGTGVIDAAVEVDKMVIGVDRDQNYLAPDNVISSMMKGLGAGVYDVGSMVINGTFKGGSYQFGIKEGGIDYAPTTSKNVPADIMAKIDELKQMIVDGEIAPPATPDELDAFTPPDMGAAPMMDASDMSFAMVTDQSGLGDQAFNDATWEGFTALNEDYGVQIKVVETSEQAQYVPNLSTLAEENEDLIVGVGFLLKDAMNEVAPLYPDTHFALIDNFVDQPNVACIQFKENEGAFLMGAIAAYMTETGKVGFVGGMETDVVKKFEMGYRAGVMTVNPDVEVLVSYAGSFADPAKGKELALAQYEEGADVVFQVAGFTGTGVIDAAVEVDKMVIGVDRDQNYLAPDNVISSMMKGLGAGVYDVGSMVINGTFKGGSYQFGIKEGGIDYAPTTSKNVPADIMAKIDELKQMIVDGEIAPPATPDELDAFTPPAFE
ncbi:MAG: BMP family protein [Anaerolineales bacterium]